MHERAEPTDEHHHVDHREDRDEIGTAIVSRRDRLGVARSSRRDHVFTERVLGHELLVASQPYNGHDERRGLFRSRAQLHMRALELHRARYARVTEHST